MPEGRCNCGAVRFEAVLSRSTVTFCHCSQCRRFSGHVWASVKAFTRDVVFHSDDGLCWYRSSDTAERGYCARCGSSLFYRKIGADRMGISAGAFEPPTGFTPGRHIYCEDQADYYDIPDDAPRVGP